ncbi:minor capsid protein [Mesobaculum littorinae]|uniref:minor capsid protein n=1 Tax=Mesobaculum littorinae TaxID=2486419 RepID=UPI0019D44C90|nr:minor capsid protein [Mesobaculum littorinae]
MRAIQSALPIEMSVVQPTAQQVYAATMARPFQGRFLREWMAGLEDSVATKVRDAIRIGFVEGETIDQIVRRVRGTKARQFKDGALEISRRNAESIVCTAVTHTANVARQETYQANGDIVGKVQWVATLDGRTTLICASRDGQTFPVDSGPRPPAHINCRSTTVPVTKSWRELGFDIDELEPATRASMNGQVPASQTYGEWLRKQPAEFQDEVLGRGKGALFRTGGLKVERFVDTKGDAYILDALREREPAAFRRSGLGAAIQAPPGSPKDAIARFLKDEPAQTELLTQVMGDLTGHRRVVTQAIKQEGWKADVNPLLGIRHYTGSSYAGLNARAREGLSTLDDRKVSALIVQGIDQLPANRATIWRAPHKTKAAADGLWDAAVEGEDLDLGNQLQSFSTSDRFVVQWAMRSDVLVRVEEPRSGAYVETITQNPGEFEVLLKPGLRYRVKSKGSRMLDGRSFRVIDLEIVEDG